MRNNYCVGTSCDLFSRDLITYKVQLSVKIKDESITAYRKSETIWNIKRVGWIKLLPKWWIITNDVLSPKAPQILVIQFVPMWSRWDKVSLSDPLLWPSADRRHQSRGQLLLEVLKSGKRFCLAFCWTWQLSLSCVKEVHLGDYEKTWPMVILLSGKEKANNEMKSVALSPPFGDWNKQSDKYIHGTAT